MVGGRMGRNGDGLGFEVGEVSGVRSEVQEEVQGV